MKERKNRRRLMPSPAEVAAQYGPPIAPVVVSRVPVFAPTERRTRTERVWHGETPWGSVAVTGCLTQLHRHLLDCAVATALEATPTDDGGITLIVDPHELMTLRGSTSWDYRWLEALLEDLRRASVRLTDRDGEFPRQVVGIVTRYGRYDRQRRLAPGRVSHRADGRRDMLAVTISGAWWGMWGDRPTAHYAAHLRAIATLSPIGQAVARLALSQRDGWRIGIDGALQAVGAWGDGDGHTAHKARQRARRPLGDDADRLGALGVHVGRMIEYRRTPDVWVSIPPEA